MREADGERGAREAVAREDVEGALVGGWNMLGILSAKGRGGELSVSRIWWTEHYGRPGEELAGGFAEQVVVEVL